MWNSCHLNQMWWTGKLLNDKTGILIDLDNKKQLTTAMEYMINNYNQYEPEKLKSMAHQFSMDNVGKKISQEYLRALN